MRKYSTPNLVKVVSLGAAMAALLSSVSPVFASGVSTTGGLVRNSSGGDVPYPHGSHGSIVFAGDDDYCGVDNVVGRGGKQQEAIKDDRRITAEEQYNRFVNDQDFGGRKPYGTTTEKVTWGGDGMTTNNGAYMGPLTSGSSNILPEAYGVYSFATGCGSAATGNYSTAFGAGATTKAGGAQAFGVSALAAGRASVAMGVGSEAREESTVAIGGLATALGKNSIALGNKTKAKKKFAIAIGTDAEAQDSGSIAIGGRRSDRTEEVNPKRKVIAEAQNAIAIGSYTYAKTEDSVAIGANAQALSDDSVAIGGGSVSDREKGVAGYDPGTNRWSTEKDMVWKSTAGAFSVGEAGGNSGGTLTRQITGVAAGSQDTDAVNVGQLRALRDLMADSGVGGGWKVSANDTDSADVTPGSTVDFSVESTELGKDNLKIEKNSANRKHNLKFALNDVLKLTQVTTGKSTLSDDGLMIENGPRVTVDGFAFNGNNTPSITIDGIDAGNQKITGVKAGTDNTDAVNYKQLQEVKKTISQVGGWKLSFDDGFTRDINPGSVVVFAPHEKTKDLAPNVKIKNINIKHYGADRVEFDLADRIDVRTITSGQSIMDGSGFYFVDANAPSITIEGINAGNKKIMNVEDGIDDFDAVNFKQLKAVQEASKTHWQLTVGGLNPMSIGQNDTVNLESASKKGHQNIKISGDGSRNVTFDLADHIDVQSIASGQSIMDGNGFYFVDANAPSITIGGINAGNKKIINVADGIDDFDAVNFKQLKNIKDQIEENSLVRWQENQKLITVGAQKDGTKINITGSEGARTIIGVKAAENDDEAVNKKQLDSRIADINNVINNINKGNAFAVLYDKNDDNTVNYNSVTLGGKENTGPVSLLNVKNGIIAANSTEAINGSQINTISQKVAEFFGGSTKFENGVFKVPRYNITNIDENSQEIEDKEHNDVGSALSRLNMSIKHVNKHLIHAINDIANYFGGGAGYDNAGEWHTPTFKVIEFNANGATKKPYNNVADAFEGVNNSFTNIHNQISDIKQNSLVQQEGENGLITVGKATGGTKIDITGSEGARTITGVKAAENDDEAVNKKQLDKSIRDISKNIETVSAAAVLYDKNDDNTVNYNSVTLGGKENTGPVALLNVGDGKISEESHDAINGSQINTISQKVAEFFGGSTKFENGIFKGPRYKITNIDENSQEIEHKEYNDVGSALSGLNMSIRHVNKHLIHAMNDVASYFGGGAGYDNAGGWHAPTFKVIEFNANGSIKKPYNNVADAFEGVNNSFTNIHNQILDIKQNSLVQQEGVDGLITVGKATGGTKISIANKKNEDRTLSGVKKATLSITSNEAVNGSQLFITNKNVESVTDSLIEVAENISQYFGGSTDVFEGIEPTFLIQGQKHHNVTDAFTGVNTSITNLDNKIIEMKENNLVQQKDGASGIITIGAKTAGTEINIAGYAGVARKISGVKAAEKGDEAVNKDQLDKSIGKISKDALLWSEDEQAFVALHEKDGKKTKSKLKFLLNGDIAEDSTDAITGHQLYRMSNQLAAYFGGGAKYENGKWTAPNFKISQIDANGTVKEQTHHNVADAFGDINSGMVNINNRIDNVINKVDSDALKWNDFKGAYDASHDGKPSKIINVADGNIAQGSKDAVNGGQLWETNERINGVEKDIKHIENRVDNISTTVTNIGETVVKIEDKVDHIDNKVNDLVDGVVLYDRDENGKKINKVTLKGVDESEPVTIDNVADGRIEKGSKEAVNGGQLRDYTEQQMKIVLDQSKHYTDQRVNNIVVDAIDDAVERANNYTNMKFEALNYSIENVRKEAKQAAAIGLAVSNLRYNDIPGKLSVAFGSGLWRSQSAFAFGAGYTSEKGNIRSNLSVTSSGGHWGVGAGFNMTLN